MTQKKTNVLVAALVVNVCTGCFMAGGGEHLVVHRRPWQMIDTSDVESSPVPAGADIGALESKTAQSTMRREVTAQEEAADAPTPSESIATARRDATQQPSDSGFVDAVQVYDYEAGAIYEVLTTPGFVTVLRLQPGEQVINLAAGDTSRWLIDTIAGGIADPHAVLSRESLVTPGPRSGARISVLIKPRRPLIATNLVIATDRRTYLIDLKSVDTQAYHSAVEWTYPRDPTIVAADSASSPGAQAETGVRNYAYVIKVASETAPSWTPVSVYDDGRRVYVRFPDAAKEGRRPPLFIVARDGSVRLVNYHVDAQRYVVHELFERAELRLGGQRVVIDRVKARSPSLLGVLAQVIGIAE